MLPGVSNKEFQAKLSTIFKVYAAEHNLYGEKKKWDVTGILQGK